MEKPISKKITTIDFLDMLNYCDNIRSGLKDRVWDKLSDWIHNDCSIWLPIGKDMKDYYSDLSEELKDDSDLIQNEFPEVNEDILFKICW